MGTSSVCRAGKRDPGLLEGGERTHGEYSPERRTEGTAQPVPLGCDGLRPIQRRCPAGHPKAPAVTPAANQRWYHAATASSVPVMGAEDALFI